jgi:hypothetical protein
MWEETCKCCFQKALVSSNISGKVFLVATKDGAQIVDHVFEGYCIDCSQLVLEAYNPFRISTEIELGVKNAWRPLDSNSYVSKSNSGSIRNI